jgi:hypothetical protein
MQSGVAGHAKEVRRVDSRIAVGLNLPRAGLRIPVARMIERPATASAEHRALRQPLRDFMSATEARAAGQDILITTAAQVSGGEESDRESGDD